MALKSLMRLLSPNARDVSHKMTDDSMGCHAKAQCCSLDCVSSLQLVDANSKESTVGSLFDMLNDGPVSSDDEIFGVDLPTGESVITSDRIHPVVFRWRGTGEEVYLSGSFDNWQTKIPLVRSCSSMFTVVDVPEGVHQYKFNVDGEWLYEPTEPTVETNEGFSCNNEMKLSSHDCNIFCALADDDDVRNTQSTDKSLIGSPPSGYSQYIPPRDPGKFNYIRNGPPQLPPQLMLSPLNAEVPDPRDSTSLANPHHVTLNHTFTVSIKDGVMVLSGTHRFKEKFITTILYRPV